jgi:glycosyltransferase involved in cell wall biosynthesis
VPARVAIDVGPLVGPLTGVGVAVDHLLAGLAALDPAQRPQLQRYVLSFRATLPAGVTRLRYPAALAHRVWARSDLMRADRRLGRPQVIHGTNYVVPPARAARLVSVYDCWFLRHPGGAHPDVARAGDVLRRAVRTGAVVHASSHATAAAVQELLQPERVEVIPLGAVVAPTLATDDDRPADGPGLSELGGRPFILAIGTVEVRKNLPRLVAAFGAIAGDHPDLALVIAGSDGNDSDAVDAAVGRLPADVRRRVLRPGRVTERTRAWLLHHARALAYASLDEGFGFPVLEAMSARLPVVASTAGSIPEVAGDAALLVDPHDVDALAAALARALDDELLRATLVLRGADQVARFDWSDTAACMADLYHSLAMDAPATASRSSRR